ncbi:BTB/POZ domain-containing protein [Klebsormidium nitens]|uniref:BTB/POZ domain-containing protein n=1 Tax=Klebsormidium nitens TaxID=105231 RepID=A0A1Y1HX41_KLENI|nr:BTB/POZ domain-containing protein [Klebsormidium nitens]|eukprot:GAQ81086.1 BTB/POZ domain-containing protein [Klebsormidium nitens]
MAEEEARSSMLAAAIDEEGHYFDFISFYRKVEFCDRRLRLEILTEGKKELEASDAATSVGPPGVAASGAGASEEIPISSIVLAAKSRVLRTMLSNGMKESDASAPVVLKVTEEEKMAFKEMLHFLYAGSLSTRFLDRATDVRELVGLLLVGDKFEVPSLIGAVLKCLDQRMLSIPECALLANHMPQSLLQLPQV